MKKWIVEEEKSKMKNKMIKVLSLAAVSTLVAMNLVACGSKAAEPTAEAVPAVSEANMETNAENVTTEGTEATTSNLSGSVTMAGSTSMEKLANAVAEDFMAKNPGVTINAEFTGSSAGVEALLAGNVDIGNSSRNLKEEEISKGAVENIVAIDGIAVVVDPANTVGDLTKEQLTAIYKGETKNWKDVGGQDSPIILVGREAGSGTRGAFEEILKVEDACAYSNELDSTGAVMAKVASTPGAIGYVSLDVVDDTVKTVKLESVEATAENIKAGSYFLSRPFVLATKGEIAEQNETVQALFAYLQSDEGRTVIEAVGLINVDK